MTNHSVQTIQQIKVGDLVIATKTEETAQKTFTRPSPICDTLEIVHVRKGGPSSAAPGTPKLAPPIQVQNPNSDYNNALDDFTKAFCTIFTAMSQGEKTELDSYLNLQDLDDTNSQAVVDSSNDAIAAEMVATTLQADVTAAEADQAKLNSELGWLQWFGLGLTVLALIAAIPAALATTATLASDEAGIELTDVVGAAASEGGSGLGGLEAAANAAQESAVNAVGDAGSEAAGNAGANAAGAPGAGAAPAEEMEEDAAVAAARRDGQQLESEKTLYRTNGKWVGDTNNYQQLKWYHKIGENFKWAAGYAEDVNGSSEAWRNKLIGKLFSFIGNSCAVAPTLVDGIAKTGIGDAQQALADQQKVVAPLMGVVQENQMNFKFFQQLLQRQTGVIQNQGEELSDIIMLAGSVMKGYQQVQTNLIHPV